MTESGALMVNQEAALHALDKVEDRVLRNLLEMGLGAARVRLAKRTEESQEEFDARRPAAPFDLAFFVDVLNCMYEDRMVVQKVLAGLTVAQASGWEEVPSQRRPS